MVAAPPAATAAMRRGFLVPEIRPLEQYDGARARSAASLAWAIATAYGGADKVPEELREPFYTDQYEQEHLKPPVSRLLLASDIYCRAWLHALGPPEPPSSPPPDNAALLLALARRGLPPTFQGTPVRDADLRHQPIKMGAHLALIDSLMAAFVTEATRGLGPPPGAPPGPNCWEQKILCWLDTVNRKLQESTERGGGSPHPPQPDGPAAPPACAHKCPTRWYWKLVPHAIAFCLKESGNKPPVIRYRKDKTPPRPGLCFPPVLGLQDLASGGALGAAIHWYCPQSLRLEDLCLSAPLSVAESLHNLRLVRDFSARHLGTRCPLALEDLLYMNPALRLNVGAFLAELFLCFEVLRPPFVQPREPGGATEAPATGDTPTPKSSSTGFNFRHPLLAGGQPPTPLRGTPGSLPHSPSLPHGESSFSKTWGKKPLSHPLSQAVSFSIPFGLDSDVDIVMGNPVGTGGAAALPRSASSDSLAPAPRRPLPPKSPPAAPAPPRPLSLPNGLPEGPGGELPTIEEALQIIHSSERLLPEGAPDAFYLHSPEPPAPKPPGDPPKEPPEPPLPARTMTSFAERKKKLEETAGGGGGSAGSPGGPSGAGEGLSAEMSQLGARLEEKRRAIEAQKKRIEAIFAQHRQRLGRSALSRMRRDPRAQGGEGEGEEEEEEEQREQQPGNGDGDGEEGSGAKKQVTFAPSAPPERYEAAVAKLSSALSSLQLDMQRLSRQQQRLLRDQRPPSGHAWVIPLPKAAPGPPPPPPAPHKAASPSPSRRAAPAPRKAPRSPRRARPAELKLPTLTRVLTPPSDVDSLPHLRKFSPSQVPVQTRCSIHFSDGDGEEEEEGGEGEEGPLPGPPRSPEPPDVRVPPELGVRGNLRPAGAARVSGDGTSDASSPGERRPSLGEAALAPRGHPRREEDEEEEDEEEEEEEGEGDSLEGSPTEGGAGGGTRPSLGFFFKEECRVGEGAMAQRRAALLQRQQQRSEAARQRRLWGGAQRDPDPRPEPQNEPRVPPEPPRPPEEECVGGSRRGAFTRQEYARRQQLKLMEELEKVLRPPRRDSPRGNPRGAPSRGTPRGTRPRCCDDSALARSPPKGLLGSRLSKVYSQSTLSLSTVAPPESGGTQPRAPSRAGSPSGPMSPGRGPPGREREWENESSASSPASAAEYTGPRLYKEPSARSNRPLIQNALAHCCLAGRANETQKIRVLEEVEKSSANHFLILFRDGSCQFRALYTLGGGDPPTLSRLAGVGPRSVPLPMVEGLFKYNSDQKRFSRIPAKTMSGSVDAFTIPGHLWQPRRPGTPKKPGTPK